jgi:Zn-dependent metalloprotease
MTGRPDPILCILPPYMLENISKNGTTGQRASANQTLTATEQMREKRLSMVGTPAATEKAEAAAAGVKNRSVYTADTGSSLPGRLLRKEGEAPSGDAAADEAYDGAGATYDLYWQVYQRDSIDGAGLGLVSTVHYQKSYDNAFWNGNQMVYGDGDEGMPPAQQLFRRFTASLDVIGHELTHGVTQHTGNLDYQGQSGALNESFSDVFGILVKQRVLAQQAADADWIIGKELFTPLVKGVGLRSMKAPGTAYNDPVLGKDPQPGHMSQYVNTTSDNGGVHINSGIPNHAFYLIAVELGSFAWQKAGQIWYVTLRDKIRSTTDFQGAADMTYNVAADLYGKGSLEQQAVKKGWDGVGITVTEAPQPTPTPPPPSNNPGCLGGLFKMLTGKG